MTAAAQNRLRLFRRRKFFDECLRIIAVLGLNLGEDAVRRFPLLEQGSTLRIFRSQIDTALSRQNRVFPLAGMVLRRREGGKRLR